MPFVTDVFTEAADTTLASHTGATGATWTKHGSYSGNDILVVGATDRARGSNIGQHLYYASGTPATAEYDVTVDMVPVAAGDTADKGGPAGRINTAANTFYYCQFTAGGSFGITEIAKKVAGVNTSLGSSFSDLTYGGATRTVKLAIRDATKKMYIGGVEQLSSTDNAITAAGKAGLYLVQSSSASNSISIHYDNFDASDAASTSSLSRSIADTVTITDAVVRSSLARARALADTITIADTLARTVAEARSLADTVTIGDALARSAVAQSRTAGDTLTITDAVDASSIASLTRDIGDTITIGDAVERVVSIGRGVADSVTIGDSLARSAISFVRAIADTITITDSLSRQVSTTAQVRTVTRYSATTRPVGQHGAGTRAVGQHRSGVNP